MHIIDERTVKHDKDPRTVLNQCANGSAQISGQFCTDLQIVQHQLANGSVLISGSFSTDPNIATTSVQTINDFGRHKCYHEMTEDGTKISSKLTLLCTGEGSSNKKCVFKLIKSTGLSPVKQSGTLIIIEAKKRRR